MTEQVILGEHWTVSDGRLATLRVFVHDRGPPLERIHATAA